MEDQEKEDDLIINIIYTKKESSICFMRKIFIVLLIAFLFWAPVFYLLHYFVGLGY